MPKLSGFMQGLNLNLGKEKERKASLIAGLALNPSLLSRAVLACRNCAHGERRRPAVGGTGQRGGFVQDSVCVDFKSSNPYNPALQGASGMQLPGRSSWMARCTPKPWAAAWVLQPPYGPHVRGGPALSLGLARSIPEPPPCPADSGAARRTPAESLLAPAPAQPSREHGRDLPAAPARCWICGAGGTHTDPQRERGCSSPWD